MRIYIQDFGEDAVLASRVELEAFLGRRFQQDANMFTIGLEEALRPCLTIYVKGDSAALYFLPPESGMYASSGKGLPGGLEVFHDSPGREIEISSDAVIPWVVARSSALEFSESGVRPANVDWDWLG